MEGRTRRRERGGRIEGKGITTKKRGQNIYVGGATGGDAEVKWGGGEAYMGRGMPISGCYWPPVRAEGRARCHRVAR